MLAPRIPRLGLMPWSVARHHLHLKKPSSFFASSSSALTTTSPLHSNTPTHVAMHTHSNNNNNNNGDNGQTCFHEQGIYPDKDTIHQLLGKSIRPYFYYIDIHGQVFLQDTTPKNLTSCYKNTKFLDFFLSRIKTNSTGWFNDYRHVSPCGREMNFVQAADTPIVYHGLHDGQLLWAGTKKTPFLPDMVTVSASTGRIYHPLPHDYAFAHPNPATDGATTTTADPASYALIKSSLVLTEFADTLQSDSLEWKGKRFPLRTMG
ncbi:hypothetical protein BG004_004926 [Podila humilis]|nr:hypothetical protein BG004_004926 [Podila humilis]